MSPSDPGKLDRIVADARRAAEKRERGYREQALKIGTWKQLAPEAAPRPVAACRPTLRSQISRSY